jgi:spore coat polysaccharide biosynthesis protein SpsF
MAANSDITAIIQARMSSRRLPNKVLLEVGGKPLIQYLLESLRQSRVRDIIVATSVDASDDAIESFCRGIGVKCHRGSLDNVAMRFVETVDAFGLKAFVRVNGDSPLLDYRLVDRAISLYRAGQYDVVTNVLKRSFPKGQSVEVVKSARFKEAYPLMTKDNDREHVTKYFYSHTDDFAIYNFEARENYSAIQLSVDSLEDMERFKAIVAMMTLPHWKYQFRKIVEMAFGCEHGQSE